MKISIVIPVYNGEKTIARLTDKLMEGLSGKDVEIILVNDGSTDDSHNVCSDLLPRYPSILTYINLSKNYGEHNAVMAGLNHVNGDYTVIMDDDFQTPPEEVLRLIDKAVACQYDVVYSYYRKKQHHWLRNLGSRFNHIMANFMLDKPKDLYLSSFKCLNRFVVQEIIKYKGPFPYIDGLILRCTRNIGRVEVSHNRRKEGCSGYTIKKLIRLWFNLFVNFSIMPLRLSSLFGFMLSCLGSAMSIFVLIEKIMHPEVPLGWPSLFIAIMVFSGVQLLMLGLLGEYLGHLFLSNNETPQFVVRKIYQETAIAKSDFRDNRLVMELLKREIIKNIHDNPDRVCFDHSIKDEDQLKRHLEQIDIINEIEPVLAVWRRSNKEKAMSGQMQNFQ